VSARTARAYRFATEAQWNACLFESAERLARGGGTALRPLAPYGGPAARFATEGAGAPAVIGVGDILWHDRLGQLHRLPPEISQPQVCAAPAALAGASRIVAVPGALWAADPAVQSLQRFDAETLTRELVVDLAPARVLDFAADGRSGLLVLLERDGAPQCVHVDHAGHVGEGFALGGIARAKALAYLRRPDRVFVLTEEGTRLYWFARGDATAQGSAALNWPRPCFVASWLACDARSRLIAAGTDGEAFGGGAHALVFDGDGRPLQDLALEAPATGLAATPELLLVATGQGLLRFAAGETVPDAESEAHCTLLTPRLISSETDVLRRWLRIEARASLPPGTTLEIGYAATDNREDADAAVRIAQDASLSQGERLQRLRKHLQEWQSLAFHGSDATAQLSDTSAPLDAPLFGVRAMYLWVCVTLSAGPGALLPALGSLEVRYAAPTLMDQLPAVYRRAEAQPGSFLRSLVGVLESTTQTLDARIAAMGALVNPASAPAAWLDFTARWLGLPWDDALEPAQKRRLATRAAEIAAARGTRAGLETLLECLLPGAPRRYRVTDVGVDYGLVTLGGAPCRGSPLPAVLGGLARSALVLDRRATLGRGRLPCAGEKDDGGSRLLGVVRIDIAATAEERGAWEPWLSALLASMVPVTARARLRWLGPGALRPGDQLGDALVLEDPPAPHLGSDAITGLARLPADPGAGVSTPGMNGGNRLH